MALISFGAVGALVASILAATSHNWSEATAWAAAFVAFLIAASYATPGRALDEDAGE